MDPDKACAPKASPFHGALYRGSVSAIDLSRSSGMVDKPSSTPPSTTVHLSSSVSESRAQRNRDLLRVRSRRQVKELVENWEQRHTRSGSVSSSEGSMSEESVGRSDAGSPDSASEAQLGSFHSGSFVLSERSSSGHPAVKFPIPATISLPCTSNNQNNMEYDQDSRMDELLNLFALSEGACAREGGVGLSETITHMPTSIPSDPAITARSDTLMEKHSVRPRDGVKLGAIPRGSNIEHRNRIVTAIFTGAPSHSGDGIQVGEAVDDVHHIPQGQDTRIMVDIDMQANESLSFKPVDSSNDNGLAMRTFEASVTATRAELETFRMRLEVVEAHMARCEAALSSSLIPSKMDGREPNKVDAQVWTDDDVCAQTQKKQQEQLWARAAAFGNWGNIACTTYAQVIRSAWPFSRLWLRVGCGPVAPCPQSEAKDNENDDVKEDEHSRTGAGARDGDIDEDSAGIERDQSGRWLAMGYNGSVQGMPALHASSLALCSLLLCTGLLRHAGLIPQVLLALAARRR